jgi:hypothetical protein
VSLERSRILRAQTLFGENAVELLIEPWMGHHFLHGWAELRFKARVVVDAEATQTRVVLVGRFVPDYYHRDNPRPRSPLPELPIWMWASEGREPLDLLHDAANEVTANVERFRAEYERALNANEAVAALLREEV